MKNKKLIGIVIGIMALHVLVVCIVIGINNSKELPNKSDNDIENNDKKVLVREDDNTKVCVFKKAFLFSAGKT